MLQIRSNVFETNSSSMHSIAVLYRNEWPVMTLEEALAEDSTMEVKDGAIVIQEEEELEFGWGFDIVDTFYGRMKYAIASIGNDKDGYEEILNAVKKNFHEIKQIVLPTGEDGDLYTGCIDHESYGTLHSYLRENEVTLADFLVNRNIIVIIDNDNSCHFEKIVQSGLFNKNSLQNINDYISEDY